MLSDLPTMTRMNPTLLRAIPFAIALLVHFPLAIAADWQASGGITAIQQASSDRRIADEFSASADLVLTRASGANSWNVHVEANSSPRAGGVSSRLPEANGDAGSALDTNRRGRVQLSGLDYRYALSPRQTLTAGLVDVSGHFDQSRIASDENTQFLGVSFTGNPSIEFPDYTLGLIYEQALENGPVLRAAIASSNGLADNPQRSYAQLVDLDANDKGVFAITSATWKASDWLLRGGAWTHTASHDALDGGSGGHRNHGAYLLAGHQRAAHAFNLRLGLANAEVSRAAGFAGLSYRYRHGPYALGIGAARIFLSPREPDPTLADTRQYELFLRYALGKGRFVTGDLQHIVHGNFEASSLNHDRAVTLYGLRLTQLFE